MARRRQTGSGNWARGTFAAFWILLGCVSGLYLFNVVTDPTLGGQLVKLSPAPSGETAAGVGSQPRDLAAIQQSLRDLSQQVAALSGRLEGSAPSDTTAPEPPAAAETSAPAEPEANRAEPPSPPQAEAPNSAQAEAPKPPEPPVPEAKPVEQAALDVTQSPAATPEPPAPPKPYEPPSVAVSPLDELPAELEVEHNRQQEAAAALEAPEQLEAPAATAPQEADPAKPGPEAASLSPAPPASPATAEPAELAASTPPEPAASQPPPPETETAALDPIALPPAANDGSTRYGIEIGVVTKQAGLRPLWREYLTNHGALVAGLQPRRVLAPDKKWRLIAGPFTSAEEASQACALFKKASRPCEATVYAGDSL